MSDYNLSSMSDKELAELKTEIRKEEERRDETITLLDSLSYRYIHGYSYKKLFKTLAELTEIFKTNGCLPVKTYYDTLG